MVLRRKIDSMFPIFIGNNYFREEEENNLPQMKRLFFLYVWLNLTRIAELRKENLVKHTRKRTIQTGRLFFSSSLTYPWSIRDRLSTY